MGCVTASSAPPCVTVRRLGGATKFFWQFEYPPSTARWSRFWSWVLFLGSPHMPLALWYRPRNNLRNAAWTQPHAVATWTVAYWALLLATRWIQGGAVSNVHDALDNSRSRHPRPSPSRLPVPSAAISSVSTRKFRSLRLFGLGSVHNLLCADVHLGGNRHCRASLDGVGVWQRGRAPPLEYGRPTR